MQKLHPSVHAEQMAIDKLPIRTSKKIIDVSLIVIRISRGTTNYDNCCLGSSKPCIDCVNRINNAIHKGYRINNIYYSQSDGSIAIKKLKDVINEKQYLSKHYINRALPKKYKELEIENPERVNSKKSHLKL